MSGKLKVQSLVFAFTWVGVSAAIAQTPLGTGFTYQGQLKDAGIPASGTYDMRFRLFDAAGGGAQIGSTDCVDGVMPVDGLFTVEIDFAAAPFDGNARWLEIAVRSDATAANCAAGPAYTVLTTRQPLTAVPYAMYALDGPGGTGGFWAANGTAISNTNAGFVGIRRSTQVSGAEYFGIQAPVPSGYGGMYIRTDGTTALPFYGYKAGAAGETAWTYLDGATGDWRVNADGDRMVVTDTGLVGIGTLTPTGKLTVENGAANPGIQITHAGTGPALRVLDAADTLDISQNAINTEGDGFFGDPLYLNNNTPQNVIIGGGGGHCGIGTGVAGLPVVELQVDGGDDASLANTTGGYIVIGATNGPNIVFDNNEFMARNNGAQSTLYINHEGGDVQFGQGGGTCTVYVPVLAITGADVAEKFPTRQSPDEIKPGMVMELDPQNPGNLRIAAGSYNRRVAGVVSGAGDIPVGAILGNLPGHENSPAIALSGRVYVMCDAGSAAIGVGDLLTTSETPGHAMKAVDYPRAQGAIIGKAMSELKAGEKGMVLVLVNLQ